MGDGSGRRNPQGGSQSAWQKSQQNQEGANQGAHPQQRWNRAKACTGQGEPPRDERKCSRQGERTSVCLQPNSWAAQAERPGRSAKTALLQPRNATIDKRTRKVEQSSIIRVLKEISSLLLGCIIILGKLLVKSMAIGMGHKSRVAVYIQAEICSSPPSRGF